MNYHITESRAIRLSRPAVLTSGYLGRGIPSKAIELAAGDQVHYVRRERSADYLPFVEVDHTVSFHLDRITYSKVCVTYRLREPFNAATYFAPAGGAIERHPEGLWNTKTAGGTYVADDGFGNLVPVPDQTARPNHYSTAKSLDDCVVGWTTWIPGMPRKENRV